MGAQSLFKRRTINDQNLLIIHQGALGDFITTFPALHLLRSQYRSIDTICQKKPINSLKKYAVC